MFVANHTKKDKSTLTTLKLGPMPKVSLFEQIFFVFHKIWILN